MVEEILAECWTMKILNANVLIQDKKNKDTVIIYTYYPYTSKSCNDVTPIVWNTFGNGQFNEEKPIFADEKLKDFYNCPLIISIRQVPPYLNFKNSTEIEGAWTINGVEGDVMNNLEHHLQFNGIYKDAYKEWNGTNYYKHP